MIVSGIKYSEPEVFLLQQTGIGTSEVAARTCYDSFEASENECVKHLNLLMDINDPNEYIFNRAVQDMNHIESSKLLDDLAWTHFHHSILEHSNLTYVIKGTSRGVLQEHSRHRIQSISVRSTRYTMSSIINAFVASQFILDGTSIQMFASKIKKLDMFVVQDNDYINIEIEDIYKKLQFQLRMLGEEVFYDIAVAKSSLPYLVQANPYQYDAYELYEMLEAGKKKRNVGDAFKHIVTDNWKVDMVVTMNLRALKNYLSLRDSGAAYFQIRNLAKAMKDVTPKKYLDLIVRSPKDSD